SRMHERRRNSGSGLYSPHLPFIDSWRASFDASQSSTQRRATNPQMKLPPEIFKAYDIRGIVGRTLTPEVVEPIGRAIGSEARKRGGGKVAIGYDGRLSGPSLAAALARGIQTSGADVIEVGRVTT